MLPLSPNQAEPVRDPYLRRQFILKPLLESLTDNEWHSIPHGYTPPNPEPRKWRKRGDAEGEAWITKPDRVLMSLRRRHKGYEFDWDTPRKDEDGFDRFRVRRHAL